MSCARPVVIALALLVAAPAAWAEGATVVRLASLEWAPYTGKDLADQGLASKVVRNALAASGYSVIIDFMPWRRALSVGFDGSQGHDGVFPVYAERASRECVSSAPIGVSPVGFAERRSDPVAWTALADLKGLRIGVMSGYFNAREFDRLAASGELTTEPVDREVLNLRKLAQGRLDLAVVDSFVFASLVAAEPDLKGSLRMNGRLLEEREIFVCFRPSAGSRSQVLRDVLNRGLAVQQAPLTSRPLQR